MFGERRSRFRMKQWWESIRKYLPTRSSLTLQVFPRTVELIACIFVLISSTLTYLYGSFEVVPEVFADYSRKHVLLFQCFTTWILFCVFSNMYLVRKRNSSIRNRMLIQPVVQPMDDSIQNMESDDQVREKARHMGEHFKPVPFGDNHTWHICAVCEIFVPPRTWHCHICNTCILRRDHHCVFAGTCIGEENQSNFLGLVFYLALGTTTSALLSLIYFLYFKEITFWWYLFRCFVMLYTVCVDFSMIQLLTTISTVGQFPAWGVFFYYIFISTRGQTSADAHRKISRIAPERKTSYLENMSEFLGPNPLMRIVWPYHKPLRVNYDMGKIRRVVTKDADDGRRSFYVNTDASIYDPIFAHSNVECPLD